MDESPAGCQNCERLFRRKVESFCPCQEKTAGKTEMVHLKQGQKTGGMDL